MYKAFITTELWQAYKYPVNLSKFPYNQLYMERHYFSKFYHFSEICNKLLTSSDMTLPLTAKL